MNCRHISLSGMDRISEPGCRISGRRYRLISPKLILTYEGYKRTEEGRVHLQSGEQAGQLHQQHCQPQRQM